jgi:hypothetical protein
MNLELAGVWFPVAARAFVREAASGGRSASEGPEGV